jgi:hypothetical protein
MCVCEVIKQSAWSHAPCVQCVYFHIAFFIEVNESPTMFRVDYILHFCLCIV